jgi:capsule polysaccharide export protein KpsE/RkpR
VKQTTHSVADVVERHPEIEPVTAAYIGEDENGGRREHHGAESLWLLWQRRRFLWRATIWGFIIVTIVAFLIPSRYESTTRLMPPDPQSGSGLAMMAALVGKGSQGGQGSLGLSSLAGDLLGMKSTGAIFTSILHSRTVEDRIIGRFDLRKVYRDKYWEDARKDLTKYTEISEERKSDVIKITVTDRDRNRAAQIAKAYVEELDRLVVQVSTSSARRERIFIEQRLVNVKQDLDDVSKQFSEYASQNTTIDLPSQAKAAVEGAARLEGELIVAQSELEGLQQIYTANNVRVRSLRARVDELKRQLHMLGGDNSASAAGDPNSLQEFPSVRKLPLVGVKWVDLYRQTKIQEAVYELLTQQYELAKIQEAKEIPTVKVLDEADVPEKKSSPKRLLLMALGTLIAFCAGVVWVFGSEAWKQMDPQDSRKQLGQEVLSGLMSAWSHWAARSRTLVRTQARRTQDKQSSEDGDGGSDGNGHVADLTGTDGPFSRDRR